MKSELTVGKVLKPRGLKGEMKIETYVSNDAQLAKVKNVIIDRVAYTVERIVLDGVFGYIQLDGIDNVDSAEALRGKDILVKRDALGKLPEGEHYIVDIIGLDVYVGGECIGEVIDISQFGSADVYTVKSATQTLSFPAIKGLILQTDLENGKLVLDDMLFNRVVVFN